MEKSQSPTIFHYLFIPISVRSASINIAFAAQKAENPIRDELPAADW